MLSNLQQMLKSNALRPRQIQAVLLSNCDNSHTLAKHCWSWQLLVYSDKDVQQPIARSLGLRDFLGVWAYEIFEPKLSKGEERLVIPSSS
jgi:hypothetical protein